MILCLADVLPPEVVADLMTRLREATAFRSGHATAGAVARTVKNNLQIDNADPGFRALRQDLTHRIINNDMFKRAVMPRRLNPVLISRYDPGMAYGTHNDNPIMDGVRTDVSFTLFLAPPDTYGGGELVIETGLGEHSFKLPAGAAVVYPSGATHRVETVTEGQRYALVGWAQSYVRDPAKREILFDLGTAAQDLYRAHGKTTSYDQVQKTVANLTRMWAEP